MDHRTAQENLDLIRTLMERATRYEHLSARAGILAGLSATLGALAFRWIDPANPIAFGGIWGAVFAISVTAVLLEHRREALEAGERLWTRPASAIARALCPALVAALALSIHAFVQGRHLELPGVWMLCYGCGALATATYAPAAVWPLGIGMLGLGAVTLWLGTTFSIVMMGVAFGGGHLLLGMTLRAEERRTVDRPVLLRAAASTVAPSGKAWGLRRAWLTPLPGGRRSKP